VLATVCRVLGVEQKLSRFYSAAKGIPWLLPLAVRMRGIKPLRYPTLWEACVNAIVFQQVSLIAASSTSRRLILTLSSPVKCGSIALYAFPDALALRVTTDGPLRAAGLSANKLATLRRVADAILSGNLDERMLEEPPESGCRDDPPRNQRNRAVDSDSRIITRARSPRPLPHERLERSSQSGLRRRSRTF
jgi:DNA-3-methyladenine glycosylase II